MWRHRGTAWPKPPPPPWLGKLPCPSFGSQQKDAYKNGSTEAISLLANIEICKPPPFFLKEWDGLFLTRFNGRKGATGNFPDYNIPNFSTWTVFLI